MTDNHPITPPPELVHQWHKIACKDPYNGGTFFDSKVLKSIATQAARWGYEQRGASNEAELQKARDQELEACCEWLDDFLWAVQPNHQVHPMAPKGAQLRKHRRPKPPSLKEQALALIQSIEASDDSAASWDFSVIRRALESLPN